MKSLQIYLLLLLFPFLIDAQSQGGYTIPYQGVKIQVHPDLSFDVTEEINVNFSEKRRGIFRTIPLRYDVNDKTISISVDDVKVRNHKSKISRENGEVVVRIGDANKYVRGDQKYMVTYTVKGAVGSYEDSDEFYWNIIGFDHDSEINRTSFSVNFPEAWADSLYAFKAYSGTLGNKGADIVVHKEGSAIVGAHRSPLAPNQGITLAVKIPKGLSTYTSISSQASSPSGNESPIEKNKWGWLTSLWNLLPLSLGAFLLGLYQKYQRGGETDTSPPLQTHPPSNMSPAEVGAFYDHKVNRRDIISLLPYWGNQGIISIAPIQDGSGDMHFRRIKDLPDEAPEYQHCLFDGLFAAGDLVQLSDLEEKFYKTMSKTAKLLKAQVVERELYDDSSKSILHTWPMTIYAIISVVIGILLLAILGAIVAGIGMILIGIAFFVVYMLPARLSEKGRQYKDHLVGLYDHLKNPVESKVKELLDVDPQYFHYMYPYVLAFDLDQAWAPVKYPKFDYMPPIWFDTHHAGGRQFRYNNSSDSINVRKIEKVFYSTPPPPSNNGGSIGGGFSGGSAGGGFGGGSTGSW